jgi:hypothetical protein
VDGCAAIMDVYGITSEVVQWLNSLQALFRRMICRRQIRRGCSKVLWAHVRTQRHMPR